MRDGKEEKRNHCYREKILATGEKLSEKTYFVAAEYGLPIINKRISLTPLSLVVPVADPAAFLEVAQAVDRAAAEIGVNFIGGYTTMIQKGETAIDRALIEAMPEVLSSTQRFCASVVLASTKAGINMDGCYTMSRVIKETAERTKEQDGIGCANSKTTAVRIIPAPGKDVGDFVHFGGLLGEAPVMAVSSVSADGFVRRGGRISAPLQSLTN